MNTNVETLTNADLLAMLVGRKTAKAIAKMPLVEVLGFVRPRQRNLGEEIPTYTIHPTLAAAKELFIRCAQEQLGQEGSVFNSPETVKAFLKAKLGHLEHEVFFALWLDTRHRLIAAEELFRGTIDGASVHPREVVKRGLALNAAAVIFAHNHPFGAIEPSRADETITRRLKDALALVEIRTLDHLVVAGNQASSFAERGLI